MVIYDRVLQAKINFTKHGLTTSPDTLKVYNAWLDIKRKCYNKSSEEYQRYGAIGRVLENKWLDDPVSFVNYMLSLPNFNMDKSIDRINNELGYFEGNLRWATSKEQARNRKKSKANNSGFQGVTIRKVRKNTFTTAWWVDIVTGKARSKTFSVLKYGLLPAFKMACDYRLKMIKELNSQGAGYSDKHGN